MYNRVNLKSKMEIDTVETINALFDQIYNDMLELKKSNDDINMEIYKNLMKKKKAVLCTLALNPVNTKSILNALTAKQYKISS